MMVSTKNTTHINTRMGDYKVTGVLLTSFKNSNYSIFAENNKGKIPS